MKPKISIIIPNYNHKPFLQERLDSVFNQTYQDFEVILLDDASTDGSAALLKNYEDHPKVSHLVLNTVNSGSPFKQWEKGIALAKGEYIWIAESDDYCELDFLETCLNALIEDVGLTYVQSVDVDDNGKRLSHRISYTKSFKPNIWVDNFTMRGMDFVSNYLIIKNVIPNASAVVFKKEIVHSYYFSEQLLNMKMCGDWLFWLQLVNQTDISFINKDLNYFRHHKQVSRIHNDIEKKKKRIFEEFIIRKHIKKELAIVNKLATKQLLNKWFRLHKREDLIKSPFYTMYPEFNKKLALAFQFIRFKLKK